MDQNIADFIDTHVTFLVKEASIYSSGEAIHDLPHVDALALALFKFVAGVTRDIAAADHAEAEFRKRVAINGEAPGGVN